MLSVSITWFLAFPFACKRLVHRKHANDVAVLIEYVALTGAQAAKFNVLADLQLIAENAESQDVDVSITTLLDS